MYLIETFPCYLGRLLRREAVAAERHLCSAINVDNDRSLENIHRSLAAALPLQLSAWPITV